MLPSAITGQAHTLRAKRVEIIVGSVLDAVGKFRFAQRVTLLIAKQE